MSAIALILEGALFVRVWKDVLHIPPSFEARPSLTVQMRHQACTFRMTLIFASGNSRLPVMPCCGFPAI
jgi:hypothetical protein